MKTQEVEMILFRVSAGGQEVINMKIYKEGTTCRFGAGGLPRLGISGMSFFGDSRFFDQLIAKVPEEVLQHPVNYEEETPNGDLEYIVAFYGVSKNGEHGEHADWAKSTGIRLKIDQATSFRHPILSLVDMLTMDAAEITNDWYFDVMIKARYGMLSSTMPRETILAQPKTPEEIDTDFSHYISQMLTSSRQWSLAGFADNKTYKYDGADFTGIIQQGERGFRIEFVPLQGSGTAGNEATPPADTPPAAPASGTGAKKPWWKIR